MPWYAVYTKPRWEKKVDSLLKQNGIESYCPLNKIVKQWSDRKKKVEVPLFTSYVFVQVPETEQQKVRMISGVVNFVYWLSKPAVIKETEMVALKDFVAQNDNIKIEDIGFKKGDNIEIEKGIFKGQRAMVNDVKKNKLELILDTLQLKLIVDISS
jgi:transcription antitermination factor NusG